MVLVCQSVNFVFETLDISKKYDIGILRKKLSGEINYIVPM
jgi:hypothetical protein